MQAALLLIVLHYTLCAFKLPMPALIAFVCLIWVSFWMIVGHRK